MRTYKLPSTGKDGAAANVGSPLTKTLNYARDGTLTSPGDDARGALDMNAQCSHWISACDRLLKQMYGSGKGPIWVQPLVAKRESSFHKQLLWHSDMQCDPAYMAHSEQCQGEIENHVGLEQRQWYVCLQGMLSSARTLIWRSFESRHNRECTIWTTWHYGALVEFYR